MVMQDRFGFLQDGNNSLIYLPTEYLSPTFEPLGELQIPVAHSVCL